MLFLFSIKWNKKNAQLHIYPMISFILLLSLNLNMTLSVDVEVMIDIRKQIVDLNVAFYKKKK